MKKITIQATKGRVPGFPESGNPIPHGRKFEVPETPQIKRMLKDGDIEEVKEENTEVSSKGKKKTNNGGKD